MLTEAYYYPFPDPFDSVITATARVLDVPLLTNDAEINASQLVDVYWEVAAEQLLGLEEPLLPMNKRQ